VITERGPDTVRGADISFYSYQRVPRGPLPAGYLAVAPDLVFEVLSPDDRWREVLRKVAEYLDAGVQVVVVLDPAPRKIHIFEGDEPARILTDQDELTLPWVLGEFRVPVSRFFDRRRSPRTVGSLARLGSDRRRCGRDLGDRSGHEQPGARSEGLRVSPAPRSPGANRRGRRTHRHSSGESTSRARGVSGSRD
jgi:hypothetical protein